MSKFNYGVIVRDLVQVVRRRLSRAGSIEMTCVEYFCLMSDQT